MEIWVNPARSKCRTALDDLDAAGVSYTVRRYLDDPPTRAELEDVLAALGLEPWDIARPKEATEEGLTFPREPGHRGQWLDGLATHPRAIQRPIITAAEGTAVIGRDPGSVAAAIRREAGEP
ncbi:MAG: arsenate reductase [Nocardioides sp.]|nr:arsenate reductase [Nocardioides sp.]